MVEENAFTVHGISLGSILTNASKPSVLLILGVRACIVAGISWSGGVDNAIADVVIAWLAASSGGGTN